MHGRIVFLDDGEMNVYAGGEKTLLHSQRKEQYQRTLENLEARYEWRSSGAGAKFMEQQNPYANAAAMAEACRVTALACVKNQLLYALTAPEMGGLYLKDDRDDEAPEGNWYSDRGFHARDLDAHGGKIALSVEGLRGQCHIAIMDEGKPTYEVITQGDTVDSAPWLSRRGNTLYYASVGNGRNEDGVILARGPSAVLQMDLASGSLTELLADEAIDYLRPKEAPDGALYFIQRPYQQQGTKGPSLLERIKGFGLMIKSVGQLIRLLVTKDATPPKSTASGNTRTQQMRLLEGSLVDVSLPKDAKEQNQGCVPDSWVLMRREKDGALTQVQKGVCDYAFDGDALIYTDGRRIFRCENGGRTLLCRGTFISRIAVMHG